MWVSNKERKQNLKIIYSGGEVYTRLSDILTWLKVQRELSKGEMSESEDQLFQALIASVVKVKNANESPTQIKKMRRRGIIQIVIRGIWILYIIGLSIWVIFRHK